MRRNARRWLVLILVSLWMIGTDGAAAQKKVEKAIADLASPSASTRRRATEVLLLYKPDLLEALPALTKALGDANRDVRRNAAEAIGSMGPEAASAVPALTEAVKRRDWSGNAQVAAAWALAQVGPTAKQAVPALVEVLGKHERPLVRREAALTLATIGPDASAALPALKKAVDDKDGFVRVAAATALCKVGNDTSGIPRIVEGLKDQSIVGTRVAADALADIGPAAKAAVPDLIEALGDPAPTARVAVARALWAIERNPAGVPALVAALSDPHSAETRERAAEALGQIVKAKKNRFPRSIAALDEYEKRKNAPPSVPTTRIFQSEDITGPSEIILNDQNSPNKWNLKTGMNFGGVGDKAVLVSPMIRKDRATPEEGAPPLHSHATGLANGQYAVTIQGYRPIAVSVDAGKTWKKIDGDRYIGTFDISDGTFDLWVDDRYAEPGHLGPTYYNTLTFIPNEPSTTAKVHGWAKERVREKLGRGTNAMRLDDGGVYVNWRLLGDDPKGVGFDVYRHEEGKLPWRVNDKPITQTTDVVDKSAPVANACQYSVVLAGTMKDRGASSPVAVQPTEPVCRSIKLQGDYRAHTVAMADLDGDGRYDYIVKQPGYSIWKLRYLWRRNTETYKLEAYDADGKFLWRYDMGWGLELAVSRTPFSAYDLDGDGRSEVLCIRGAPDPRDAEGHVNYGQVEAVVLDGATGKVRCRAPWPSIDGFTQDYGWRCQLCVAYLDGKTPCLILQRGVYNLQKAAAWQMRNGRLERLWNWTNLGAGKKYWGQGAHTIHAADVDGDGRDEVVIGSSVLDDDGSPLWSTGLGHIDQCFVGDIDPQHPGMEMFYTAENRQKKNGVGLVDARTGKIIWGRSKPTTHVGFGLAADIDATYPGSECSACEDPKADPKGKRYEGKPPDWLYSAQGKIIAENRPKEEIMGSTAWGGAPRAAWWNADLQRELINKGRIFRYGGEDCAPTLEGTILAVADVTGDWREEIFTTMPGELRIYSTRIPARDRHVCLMQDANYRLCTVSSVQAYYSLPQLSVDLSSATPSKE